MPLETINLAGAVSFVTGAGGGMGESIARELAARGGTVVVADIEKEAAERVAEEIVRQGGRAEAMRVDVSDAQVMQTVADEVFARHGRVDVLVNNAGVVLRPARAIWDASLADFEWVMRVNYFGVVNGILAFLPRMRAKGTRGHIVNTSTFFTLYPEPGFAPYTASKAAIDAFSDVLRLELEDQNDPIGLTILYPGGVSTRIATSDRLRGETDRSSVREVKPYQRVHIREEKLEYQKYIEPDLVGPMVIEAIEQNHAYCLTHPAPVEILEARIRACVAGEHNELSE